MKISETPEIRKEGKEKYMDSKGIHPDLDGMIKTYNFKSFSLMT